MKHFCAIIVALIYVILTQNVYGVNLCELVVRVSLMMMLSYLPRRCFCDVCCVRPKTTTAKHSH